MAGGGTGWSLGLSQPKPFWDLVVFFLNDFTCHEAVLSYLRRLSQLGFEWVSNFVLVYTGLIMWYRTNLYFVFCSCSVHCCFPLGFIHMYEYVRPSSPACWHCIWAGQEYLGSCFVSTLAKTHKSWSVIIPSEELVAFVLWGHCVKKRRNLEVQRAL